MRAYTMSAKSNFCSYNSQKMGRFGISRLAKRFHLPQHFLYFFPLPQGQGSFLPILFPLPFLGSSSGLMAVTYLWDMGRM